MQKPIRTIGADALGIAVLAAAAIAVVAARRVILWGLVAPDRWDRVVLWVSLFVGLAGTLAAAAVRPIAAPRVASVLFGNAGILALVCGLVWWKWSGLLGAVVFFVLAAVAKGIHCVIVRRAPGGDQAEGDTGP